MLRIIKKISKVLNRHQKSRIIILFFMMVIAAALNVVGVGMMLPLMTTLMDKDAMTESPLVRFVTDLFHINSQIGIVMFFIFLMIVIYMVKDFYAIFETYIQNRFVSYNRFSTQSRILSTYLHRPYEFFLHASSGEIVRVIQSDIAEVFKLLSTLLFFFSEMIITIALVATVFVISPFITLIVAGVMLLTVLVITLGIRPMLRRQGKVNVKHAAIMNKWLLQSINGIKEIKVTDTEDYFRKNFDKSGLLVVRAGMKQSVWTNIPQMLIEMTSITSALIAVAIQVANGAEMTGLITQLSAFVMASTRLLPGANRIVNAASNIAYYEPSLDKVIDVMYGDSELSVKEEAFEPEKDSEDASSVSFTVNKEIRLDGISYSYPESEAAVLESASMLIPVGKSIGIVGASGAGKTTSVDILLGLLVPKEGHVYADGIDVMTNYKSWLRHIGYIPQSIFMLDDTIRENVVFGSRASLGTERASDTGGKKKEQRGSDDLVWKALEEAQLADFVRSLPDGLDTEIGERGVRLSGGQRQRIGIARALYSSPDILVFDEATSSLDNETEAAIMESINALHGKKTLIIIAHRLTTIEGCDIVYRVEGGKIVRER